MLLPFRLFDLAKYCKDVFVLVVDFKPFADVVALQSTCKLFYKCIPKRVVAFETHFHRFFQQHYPNNIDSHMLLHHLKTSKVVLSGSMLLQIILGTSFDALKKNKTYQHKRHTISDLDLFCIVNANPNKKGRFIKPSENDKMKNWLNTNYDECGKHQNYGDNDNSRAIQCLQRNFPYICHIPQCCCMELQNRYKHNDIYEGRDYKEHTCTCKCLHVDLIHILPTHDAIIQMDQDRKEIVLDKLNEHTWIKHYLHLPSVETYLYESVDLDILRNVYNGKQLFIYNWDMIWKRECTYNLKNVKIVPFYNYTGNYTTGNYIKHAYIRICKYRSYGFTISSDVESLLLGDECYQYRKGELWDVYRTGHFTITKSIVKRLLTYGTNTNCGTCHSSSLKRVVNRKILSARGGHNQCRGCRYILSQNAQHFETRSRQNRRYLRSIRFSDHWRGDRFFGNVCFVRSNPNE